jgi:hypothetical protein
MMVMSLFIHLVMSFIELNCNDEVSHEGAHHLENKLLQSTESNTRFVICSELYNININSILRMQHYS